MDVGSIPSDSRQWELKPSPHFLTPLSESEAPLNVLLLQTTHMDKSAPIFWEIFLNEDSFVQGLTTFEASDPSVNNLPPSFPTALPICHALAMDPG